MKADLNELKLESLVIHHMRRWNEEDFGDDLPTPIKASKISKLGAEERRFLEEKVVKTAEEPKVAEVQACEEEVSGGNENPGRLRLLLQSADSLVATTRSMVDDLRKCQGKRAGLDYLIVIGKGSCKGRSVLVLFTMNIEKGLRAILDKPDSPPELQQIKDLVLEGKAHLNKMVALELDDGKLVGIVTDHIRKDADAAAYFLTQFLGLETTDSAREQTKAFVDTVTKVANVHTKKAEDKIELQDALSAEVSARTSTINIPEFRKKHVPADLYPAFDAELLQRGLKKEKIVKDPMLVAKRVKRVVYRMNNGIEIRVPSTLEGAIESAHDAKGPFVKIRGEIERTG